MAKKAPSCKPTPCDMDFHPYQNHTWVQLHEVVVDKEYQLECARDELQRFAVSEQESKRKDDVITALRKEIAEYKKYTQSGGIRCASMEEHLSSNESHLQERIKDVQKLQSELENVQGKLKSTTSKCTSMQKELSKVSQANSQHDEQVRDLKKQQKCDAETISALRRELADKKSNTSLMQEKVKRFHSENQEMQKRLECLRTDQEIMITSEKKLKAEVARLKNHASSGHLLQAKYDFTEQELLKAKDKENSMIVELGRLESELSELRGHVLACFQVPTTDEASTQAIFHVITQFAEDYFEAEEKLASHEQDLEEYKGENSALISDVLQLCKHWKEFQDGVKSDVIGAVTLLAENLQKIPSEDENVKELLDAMRESVRNLHSLKSQSHDKLSHLENHIKSCYQTLKEHDGEEDPIAIVANMTSSLQLSEKLKERFAESELEHSASLSSAVTALRQDERARLNDAIMKTKLEEEERLCRELKSAREQHVLEKQKVLSHEQEVSTSLRKELETMKSTVKSDAQEKESLQAKLAEMDSKLVAAEMGNSEAISGADSFKATLEHQFAENISEYKEQAQQYAFTIVAMEEKLLRMMENCKAMQTDNKDLKEHLSSTTSINTAEIKVRDKKMQKMEELIGVLRNQLRLASVDGGQKETSIQQLEDQILELNKEKEESEAQVRELHCREITDLQLTMAKQETIIECQKTEMEKLTENLHKKNSELANINQQCTKMTEELSAMQEKIEESNSTEEIEYGHLTLVEAGHMCLGEKHCETINNQRTAVAQLREKLKELELAKPPLGSHQATLKELSRVRHELLKAKSTIPKAKPDANDVATATTSKSEQTLILKPQFTEGSRSQETALHQVEETLECSERMYRNLVETICRGMPNVTRYPLENEDQLKATDEQSKKKQVLKERKKFADTVYRQLIHQAKGQASRKSSSGQLQPEDASSAEEIEVPKMNPEEVIASLEAVLSATAEELEQQKRLNQSLLKRKNFKESQLIASMQRPRHRCVTGANNDQIM